MEGGGEDFVLPPSFHKLRSGVRNSDDVVEDYVVRVPTPLLLSLYPLYFNNVALVLRLSPPLSRIYSFNKMNICIRRGEGRIAGRNRSSV